MDKHRKVSFNLEPKTHIMHAWSYAYRAARCGEWEQFARDHERYRLRIHRLSYIINPVLIKKHDQIGKKNI